MSANTWKKEFYPITAREAAEGTNLEAVRHSLQKWKGLRPDNMKKHKLILKYGEILYKGEEVIVMGDTSCSLCVKHDTRFGACGTCPLSRSRGGNRCDRTRAREEKSPWGAWITYNDPEPMIAALEKAEARLLQEQARKRKAG